MLMKSFNFEMFVFNRNIYISSFEGGSCVSNYSQAIQLSLIITDLVNSMWIYFILFEADNTAGLN